MEHTFSYLIYSLLFLAVWLILFLGRKDLRRNMMLASLLIAPMGPLSEIWYLNDYWQRPTITGHRIGIEDLIFAFALGGITFSFYKTVFGMTTTRNSVWPRRTWLMVLFPTMILIALLLVTNIFHINSIFSSAFSFIAFAIFVWRLRPDLIRPSVASGFICFVLFLLVYQLMEVLYPGLSMEWCMGCNPSGLRILGINIEELLWDFSWGLVGGILYEAVTGKSLCGNWHFRPTTHTQQAPN